MSSVMAPNAIGVDTPGRRTVYSMCGMCAVRCPIEVTVQDGRAVWLQGNPHDTAIGASLCAKGAAGLSFEYDDDQRPQTPLIRKGPRGSGQWRRASSHDARRHRPPPRGPMRISGVCGRWSSSYSNARPAEPLAHRLAPMALSCGLPCSQATRPFSTVTSMGQRTAHMPHML